MGTPDFAVPSLEALIAAGHDVVCVYTQPPRPAGRGQQVQPSPVQRAAEAHGIAVRVPRSLRNAEAQAEFAALAPDAAVVAAYGLILPQPVLDAPRLGCFNVHGSLLPRWRGAAPLQRAILAGDTETGITIMRMDAGLDTGGMLLMEAVPIAATTTASDLHDGMAALGARLVVAALDAVAAGRLTATPQPAEGVTYAAKLSRDDGRLDWAGDAATIERQVRALTPWPGCWFDIRGERIKVLAAEPAPEPAPEPVAAGQAPAAPGTVLDDRFTVACGQGAIRIARVQRPGKAPVDGAAFLRGFQLPPGTNINATPCPAGS
jgi:methionyl-tRNA formyltransferase